MSSRQSSSAVIYGIFLTFIVVWALIMTFKAWPTYHGYCKELNMYPSDNERIRSGVAYVLDTYPPDQNLTTTRNGVRVTGSVQVAPESRYRDINDFIQKNPHCCTLTERDPETGGPGFIPRLTGAIYNFVRVHYIVVYDRNGERLVESYTKYIPTDVCGKATSRY